jgi:hypothetical protein
MPKKKPTVVPAAQRADEARRIVARQRDLVVTLKALGRPADDAERVLKTYVSALKHLEDHVRKFRAEARARKREAKKPRPD